MYLSKLTWGSLSTREYYFQVSLLWTTWLPFGRPECGCGLRTQACEYKCRPACTHDPFPPVILCGPTVHWCNFTKAVGLCPLQVSNAQFSALETLLHSSACQPHDLTGTDAKPRLMSTKQLHKASIVSQWHLQTQGEPGVSCTSPLAPTPPWSWCRTRAQSSLSWYLQHRVGSPHSVFHGRSEALASESASNYWVVRPLPPPSYSLNFPFFCHVFLLWRNVILLLIHSIAP